LIDGLISDDIDSKSGDYDDDNDNNNIINVMIIVLMKTDFIYSFAIAGLRSLFGVLSKAVTDLKYLEKVSVVLYCYVVV